ncbi:MAG: hypothetical protein WAX89_00955 [Alphaproteobacteria bacterium]
MSTPLLPIGLPKAGPKRHQQLLHKKAKDLAEWRAGSCIPFTVGLSRAFVEGRAEDLLADYQKGRLYGFVCGSDKAAELAPALPTVALPFGQCRFAIYGKTAELPPTGTIRMVTSYPNVARQWLFYAMPAVFARISIEPRIGGCEAAVANGWADIAFDIVDTGESVRTHNLTLIQDHCLPVQAVWIGPQAPPTNA